jgi:S-(hydroxymethyl)glutathione dehydrogenase/alcohol dehydrogenase
MKAAILLKKNEPLVVDDISLPETLDYGQVLVKVLVSGLCGAQLQEIAGLKGNEKFMPHLIGHEGCGLVEKVGGGVSKVNVGDKVVLHWRKGSGIESAFPRYDWNGITMSGGKVTTISEYSVVSENRLTKIDQSISNDFAALLGCGISTGFSVVNKDANIKFGERVLVIGCGGVGLNCIYASKLSHALVWGVDINKDKKELVEKNGGTFFHSENDIETIKKMKFDCIIDTTGILSLVSQVLETMSEQGRCILVAQPKTGSFLTINNPGKLFSTNGQSIRTTQAGGFDPDVDIPRYINLYKNNQIKLEHLITHRYSLTNINDAVIKLKSGLSGRIMIDIC